MKIAERLRSAGLAAFLVFTGVYAAALAGIFWGTWSLDAAPVSPDCATSYSVNDASIWLKGVLAGGSFVPSDLMHVVGGMYFWQELQFALAAWLAALGVAFYLRGRGLSLVACYGGGAAFGLMGYCFTLFSAGHLGWFVWLMYGLFAFGLADRCVRKGGWARWALLGATVAWASARQPDLWLMFTLLTFAYGVWCIVRERKALFGEGGPWRRRLAGAALCAAVTFAVGTPQFRHAIVHDIAGREAQISSASSRAGADGEDAAAKAKKAEERWLFCTSWSLPPEDTLEFAVAEIHGGSNDPRVFGKPGNEQYRGRLGSHGVVPPGSGGRHPVTGEMLRPGDEYWMPYRQHSLYFGLLTLLFAAAGAFAAFAWRRKGAASKHQDGGADYSDAPFWVVTAALVYLCALGGFTPFYRLVFALPFGDSIRCPVKFVHLLEMCAAVLAGYGIEWLRSRFGGGRAWVAPALAALAAVNVFDLARVDAKYLAVQDVSFLRAANDAAEDVVRLDGGRVYVAVPQQEGGQAIRESLGLHLAETADADGADVRFVLAGGSAFQADPSIGARLKSGELKAAGYYSISRRNGVRRSQQRGANLILLQKASVPAPGPKPEPPPDRAAQMLGLVSLLATLAVAVSSLAAKAAELMPRACCKAGDVVLE